MGQVRREGSLSGGQPAEFASAEAARPLVRGLSSEQVATLASMYAGFQAPFASAEMIDERNGEHLGAERG